MTAVLQQVIDLPATFAVLGIGAALVLLMLVTTLSARRQQKAFQRRLDERITHLTTGLSLLTNTTEEGLRVVALEIARLSRASDPAPQVQGTARQRIAKAAGHGRSIQDIAASEQLSEGEVLLHLLMDRLQPEAAVANVC